MTTLNRMVQEQEDLRQLAIQLAAKERERLLAMEIQAKVGIHDTSDAAFIHLAEYAQSLYLTKNWDIIQAAFPKHELSGQDMILTALILTAHSKGGDYLIGGNGLNIPATRNGKFDNWVKVMHAQITIEQKERQEQEPEITEYPVRSLNYRVIR